MDPYLAVGLACVIAGIVGGGLRALGVEIPALQSVRRQVLLGGVGVVLVAFSPPVQSWWSESRKPEAVKPPPSSPPSVVQEVPPQVKPTPAAPPATTSPDKG